MTKKLKLKAQATHEIPLTEMEIRKTLSGSKGVQLLTKAVLQASDHASLVQILNQWIHFNAVFGGGVTALCGQLSRAQHLFFDTQEQIQSIADRSNEVAAKIFYASVDEFGGRSGNGRGLTHRQLAQATTKGLLQVFKLPPSQTEAACQILPFTSKAAAQVSKGYLASTPNSGPSDRELFNAIGFHMGSEILADDEFTKVTTVLWRNFPHEMNTLKKLKIGISGVEVPAYTWLLVHSNGDVGASNGGGSMLGHGVEEDHFQIALDGANLALRYFCNQELRGLAKLWIVEGLAKFDQVQGAFMASLERVSRMS